MMEGWRVTGKRGERENKCGGPLLRSNFETKKLSDIIGPAKLQMWKVHLKEYCGLINLSSVENQSGSCRLQQVIHLTCSFRLFKKDIAFTEIWLKKEQPKTHYSNALTRKLAASVPRA